MHGHLNVKFVFSLVTVEWVFYSRPLTHSLDRAKTSEKLILINFTLRGS